MELYEEILCRILAQEKLQISFPDLKLDAAEVINSACYQALLKIKFILEDDRLNDKDCFLKIENIVQVFENLGGNCGNRHDFG